MSVVIPSYNYAKYLDARIESILSQTYSNIEIIIIDDCSPDNSVEVLQKYKGHPSIKLVLRKKNEGWISANNEGVKLANGEFILFAQCDDTCDLTLVARLMDAMQAHPSAGLAFCRSLLVNSAGETIREDYADRSPSFQAACSQDVLLTKEQMSEFLLHSCVIPNLSAVLIRKGVFKQVGFFPCVYPACADWAWFLSVAREYDVAYVAKPLNKFMQHEATIRSVTKGKVLFEEYFRLLLSNLKVTELTPSKAWLVRLRAMDLWAVHVLSPSIAGIMNSPYHFLRIVDLDPLALLVFPIALARRFFSLLLKSVLKVLVH